MIKYWPAGGVKDQGRISNYADILIQWFIPS